VTRTLKATSFSELVVGDFLTRILKAISFSEPVEVGSANATLIPRRCNFWLFFVHSVELAIATGIPSG
jgi:hypothetical protein